VLRRAKDCKPKNYDADVGGNAMIGAETSIATLLAIATLHRDRHDDERWKIVRRTLIFAHG
jgi:hypothetical protein